MGLDNQHNGHTDELQTLLLRCRNRIAQVRLQEAVECYKLGLTNQCVLTTWQAVVLDYLAKLQELEGVGNETAGKELRNYRAILRSNNVHRALEFESELIEKAHTTFAFIPGVDATDLEHLRDDRHRAAHPTMRGLREPFRISMDRALLHMRSAVDLMLSVPAFEGAGPAAELERIISLPGFAISRAQARTRLLDSPLKDAGSSAIREILEGQFTIALRSEESDQLSVQRGLALATLSDMYPVEFGTFMPDIVRATVRGRGWNPGALLALLHVLPSLWDSIPDRGRATLARHVSRPLSAEGENRLLYAYRVPELRSAVQSRAKDITEVQLRWMANSGRRADYVPLITASLIAHKRPTLLAEFLQKWPDLIECLSIQDAIAAGDVLKSVSMPATPTLEPVPEGGPKNLLDGVLRFGSSFLAAAHDASFRQTWTRVRHVSAALRRRMAQLMDEATLDDEAQVEAQRAQAALLQLERSLEFVPSGSEEGSG